MPLYGHELTEETDPLSAGLAFAVTLNKDELEQGEKFPGQEDLKQIAAFPLRQKLVGLNLEGQRTARQGMAVLAADKPLGLVTSGCVSPTLDSPIAMAYLDATHADPGTTVQIDLGSARARCAGCQAPLL